MSKFWSEPTFGHCVVCGDSHAEYMPSKRQRLCRACAADTPDKVTRDEFERVYWQGGADSVPRSTRQSFWEDYLSSTHTLPEYIKATSEPV